MDQLATPDQIADMLQVSKSTVLNKIHSGDWECTKISDRIYRFTEDQIEAIKAGTNRRARKSERNRMHEALRKIS